MWGTLRCSWRERCIASGNTLLWNGWNDDGDEDDDGYIDAFVFSDILVGFLVDADEVNNYGEDEGEEDEDEKVVDKVLRWDGKIRCCELTPGRCGVHAITSLQSRIVCQLCSGICRTLTWVLSV